MMKRILSGLLALLMVVSILPVPTVAEETDYSGNVTGTAKFNPENNTESEGVVTTYGRVYVTDDPTLGLNMDLDYTLSLEGQMGQTFVIDDYYSNGSGYWYKLAAQEGETLPKKLESMPWVYQNDIPSGMYPDALVVTPPVPTPSEPTEPSQPENSCKCCEDCTGAEGCECQCGDCAFCEKEPENSCECCEDCTGAEGCECQCGQCDFCEKEEEPTQPSQPENPCDCDCGCESCTGAEGCQCHCGNCGFCETEISVLEDEVSGVTVFAESFSEGVSLSVSDADVTAQLNKFGVPASKQVFGLDISLVFDGQDYQPEDSVLVKVPVSAAPGTIIAILHTHGDDTTFMGMTEVLSDGTIAFITNSFSEFAGFTVDFYYEGVEFSIEGMSSILLSELFTALGVDEDASQATSVVFTDNDLVGVAREGDDWRLTSLEAFQTEETLAVSFSDGRTVIIFVTDQTGGKEPDGSGNTYRYYLLGSGPNWAFSDRGILVWYNNALAPGWGGGTQEITLVMTFPDGTEIRDTGTHFFQNGWSKCDLKFRSNGSYWFEITDWPYVNMQEEGNEYYSYSVAEKNGGTSYIYIQARKTLVNEWDMCTVVLEPKTAKSSAVENRTVQIYLNGSLYDYKTVPFPARDSSLHSHISYTDETKANSADIRVTFNNQSRYTYTGISLDQSNKIYKLYFTSKHTVTWKNWDGTVLETDSGVAYGSNPSYNSATPTRASTAQYHYSFTGWNPTVSTVTADQTYTAQFSSTTRGYTVTWKNYDGSTLETDTNVLYNTTPTYDGNTPTKPSTAQFKYTWSGWDKTVSPVTGDVTYTATFTESKVTYTVTWKNWDDTTLKTDTVAYGNSVTYSGSTPTRDGVGYTYTFSGWNKGSNGTISNVTADTTVTAQFSSSLISYSIGYNLVGGTVATANPTSYNIGSASFALNNPTKPGYIFTGWTEAISTSNWTAGFINFDTGAYENSTTYPNAVYSEMIYLEAGVTYTLSGTGLGGIRWRFFKTDGTYVGSTSDAVFTPTQNGYVHILLYEGCTDANRNAAKITSSQGTTVPIVTGSTGNRYYTANWSANTYTVVFNGNGATDGDMENQGFTYDKAQNLLTNAFARKYTVTYDAGDGTVSVDSATAAATFNGWATSETGTKVYNNQQSVSNLTTVKDGTYTLYANWTLGTVTLPTPDERENYTFDGWSDGTTTYKAEDVYTPTANVILTAVWTPNIQTVTVTVIFEETQVEPDGDWVKDYTTTADGNLQLEVNLGDTIAMPTFKARNGYMITEIKLGNNEWDPTETNPKIEEDTVITVTSAIQPYQITYDLAGGELPQGVEKDIQTYDITQTITLMAKPTRSGWKFTGWKLNEKVGNWDGDIYTAAAELGAGLYGDITLTAQWQEQYRYELNLDANDGTNTTPRNLIQDWTDASEHTFSWQTADNPTRSGYTLKGWAEEADSTTNVSDGDNNSYKLTGQKTETVTKTLYAVWERKTGELDLEYIGDGAPIIVTVTCTEAVNPEEKITIQLVIDRNTTLSNLPTGKYAVNAEPGRGNYTASATPGLVTIDEGQTSTVKVSTAAKDNGWFTGFSRVINRCQ